ncbi:MAG TPA: hypothetical protein VF510_16950 [Ktedonobacterales bacterium]
MEEQGETRKTYSRRTLAPREGTISGAREGGDGIVGRDTQRITTSRTATRTVSRPTVSRPAASQSRALIPVSRPLPVEARPGEEQEEVPTLLLRAAPVSRQVRQSQALVPVAAGSPDRLGGVLRWWRYIAFGVVALAVVLAFGYSTLQAQHTGKTTVSSQSTPLPTGRGPWSTLSAVAVAPAPPKAAINTVSNGGNGVTGTMGSIEPCKDAVKFVPNISAWTVPPGCYALVYTPNPANYIQAPGFGWCNWWVRVSHPNRPDITENTSYPRGTKPVAGAAIFFDGNEQGAGPEGHWAEAVAVAPDGYWVLISEMNFAWRGAGFGKVEYRYIHVSPGVHFVYA